VLCKFRGLEEGPSILSQESEPRLGSPISDPNIKLTLPRAEGGLCGRVTDLAVAVGDGYSLLLVLEVADSPKQRRVLVYRALMGEWIFYRQVLELSHLMLQRKGQGEAVEGQSLFVR
jgi:hypothetical protein